MLGVISVLPHVLLRDSSSTDDSLYLCTGICIRPKIIMLVSNKHLLEWDVVSVLVPKVCRRSVVETNGGVLMHLNFDSFIIIVIFLFGSRDAKRRDFSVSESIVLWYFLCIFSVKIRECNVTSEYKQWYTSRVHGDQRQNTCGPLARNTRREAGRGPLALHSEIGKWCWYKVDARAF